MRWINKSVDFYWVEKKIPEREWNSTYSQLGSYTFLGESDGKVSVGFLDTQIPFGGIEIYDDELLRRIDLHRRAINLRPYPLENEEEKRDRLSREEKSKGWKAEKEVWEKEEKGKKFEFKK